MYKNTRQKLICLVSCKCWLIHSWKRKVRWGRPSTSASGRGRGLSLKTTHWLQCKCIFGQIWWHAKWLPDHQFCHQHLKILGMNQWKTLYIVLSLTLKTFNGWLELIVVDNLESYALGRLFRPSSMLQYKSNTFLASIANLVQLVTNIPNSLVQLVPLLPTLALPR